MALHSMRVRLIGTYLLVALVAVGLVGLIGMFLIRLNAIERQDEMLSLYAEMARTEVQPLLSFTESPVAEIEAAVKKIARLGGVRVKVLAPDEGLLADSGDITSITQLRSLAEATGEEDIRVIVLDEQGNVLGESSGIAAGQALEFTINPTLSPDSTPQGERLFRPGEPVDGGPVPVYVVANMGQSKRVVQVDLREEGGDLGSIEVSGGPDLVASALDSAKQPFLVSGLVALAVSLLVGLLMSRRISAPVIDLTEVASQMRQGDLNARAQVQGQDEVGALAAQFNRMAEELQASFQSLAAERDTLRRFVGDASHELRTPITALQMFIELLQSDSGDDLQERASLLADSQIEINRLAWVTKNLLNLSRMDAGMFDLSIEPCPAADLVAAVCSECRARAAEKSLTLEMLPVSPDLLVPCDRPRLEMVLSNLLENAIKFTPPGGSIRVGAEADRGGVHFWVEDTGCGIAPEDLPHIFERFYRGKDRSTPGSGLGLAIVKGIIDLHGGLMQAESKPEAGTRLTVWLPVDGVDS